MSVPYRIPTEFDAIQKITVTGNELDNLTTPGIYLITVNASGVESNSFLFVTTYVNDIVEQVTLPSGGGGRAEYRTNELGGWGEWININADDVRVITLQENMNTHQLLSEQETERVNNLFNNIAYYGDPYIVVTDSSKFTYSDNDDETCTITAFTSSNLTNFDIVVPYEINGLKVTKIGDLVFQNSGFHSLVIPNTVTTIGSKCFEGFGNFEGLNVTIPDSVVNIASDSFEGLYSLDKLTIYCNSGSYAEQYAIENGIKYKSKAVYVDSEYDPNSTNPQSGKAVAEAISALSNGGEGIQSIDIGDAFIDDVAKTNTTTGMYEYSSMRYPPKALLIVSDAGAGAYTQMLFYDGIVKFSNHMLTNWVRLADERDISESQYAGVGQSTSDGGEIFNDYENNKAIAKNATANGSSTLAGCTGYYLKAICFDTSQIVAYVTNDTTQTVVPKLLTSAELGGVSIEKREQCSEYDASITLPYVAGNHIAFSLGGVRSINLVASTSTPVHGNSIVIQGTLHNDIKASLKSYVESLNENEYGQALIALGDLEAEDWAMWSYDVPEGCPATVSETGFATGTETRALGKNSFTQGKRTIAAASHSAAFGHTTRAGYVGFATGKDTVASAPGSTTFGNGTIAQGSWQVVDGQYNEVDYASNYVEITGGGDSTTRKNIRTLDWSGNAHYAGEVYVGANKLKLLNAKDIQDLYYSDPTTVSTDESLFKITDANRGVISLKGEYTDTEIVVPYKVGNTLVRIINSSFLAGNTTIKKVVLPNTVTNIASNAFNGCSNLEEINLPDSVIAITYSAFENCTSLTSLKFSDNISVIDANLCKGCTNLATVTLPANLKTIKTNAFDGTGLADVVIPEGTESIINDAFKNCKLNTIVIPDSVTSMSVYTFDAVNRDFTVYCNPHSYAEQYAKTNNLSYDYIDAKDFIILKSSAEGSNKKFMLTVGDDGALSVTQITEV